MGSVAFRSIVAVAEMIWEGVTRPYQPTSYRNYLLRWLAEMQVRFGFGFTFVPGLWPKVLL